MTGGISTTLRPEGIYIEPDFRDGVVRIEPDAEDIESDGRWIAKRRQIKFRGAGDARLFFGVNGCGRRQVGARGTGLYFHERKYTAMLRDDVNLARLAAIVAGE